MKTKYPKYLECGDKFVNWIVLEVDEDSKIDKNGKPIGPSKWN